ncbi:biotin/lipoyl-binding protein [Xylophilus sp.]|uniref:biotin/lipoyl-binding protein n=1 Tax=Xylophilus sp. TaxID=2653893 RepID=UPI0013B85F82|nr:biotin/lipoyl-binding protein [Xylophilus sp.]KAF1049993.1 MAG: Multidrug resistance protein MdtE [Xylophilus sp.]
MKSSTASAVVRAARGLMRSVLPLAIAGLLVACSRSKEPPQAAAAAPEVGVFVLQPVRQTFTTELPGRVQPFLSADIRPQVGGIVKARLFTEGATVRAGQVLYEIDPAPYTAALASARAALERARATAVAAESTAKRNAELVAIDAVSR